MLVEIFLIFRIVSGSWVVYMAPVKSRTSVSARWTWSNLSQPVTMLPARKAGKAFSVQRQFVRKAALPARVPAPGLVSVAAGKNVQIAHNPRKMSNF